MATWPDPRSISVGFAFGHTQYEDPTGLTFEVVSPADDPEDGDDPGPVLESVEITRGRVGDAAETSPTVVDLRMRNDDGEFSPQNVSGDRYGTLRPGTPGQIAVDLGSGPQELATAFALDFIPSRQGPDIDPQVAVPMLGLLNRIARDTDVLSALRRTLNSPFNVPPKAYWPMEDSDGATVFGSAVSGGSPASFNSIDLAADSTLAGSQPLPVFLAATTVSGTVSGTFSGGWTVAAWVKFPAALSGLATLMEIRTSGGTAERWVVSADATTIYVNGYLGATTVYTASSSSPYSELFSGDWVVLSLNVENGVDFFAAITPIGSFASDTVLVASGTVDGGDVTGWLVPASTALTGLAIGHVVAQDFPGSLESTAVPKAAAYGYVGETAFHRISRLLSEAGIAQTVLSPLNSQAMGAQLPGTTYRLLREAEDVDGGDLFDGRDGKVVFLPVERKYNASVSLTIAYGTEEDLDVGSNITPGDADRDTYNIATVTGPDGTTATYEEPDGPKGSDTTTGIGARAVSASRNVYLSSQLLEHAGAIVRRGTTLHPSYVLTLDLYANPDLFADWLDCDVGSRIVITDPPAEDFGPDDLDLIIVGEKPSLDAATGMVTVYCEPFEPYRVQQLTNTPPDDDLLDGWLIPDSCSLAADVTSTATSWSVNIDPLMTTSADDFPCRVSVDGEEVWVTACSGASSPQTWTVTRSVNGVVKAHDADAEIVLLDPLVLTL